MLHATLDPPPHGAHKFPAKTDETTLGGWPSNLRQLLLRGTLPALWIVSQLNGLISPNASMAGALCGRLPAAIGGRFNRFSIFSN
jgi:hypothetical protein